MGLLKINAPSTLDKMVEISDLSSSPFDGKTWYVEVLPCASLTCACKKINLLFRNLDQIDTTHYSFYMEGDIDNRKLSDILSNLNRDSENTYLAPSSQLEKLLTQEDWENLDTVRRIAKGVLIDDHDLLEVEADFPKELLKTPSTVVLFKTILPQASYFYFNKADNIPYVVLDQYCSNFKCDCTNMILTFTEDGQNEEFAIRYNYQTEQIEVLESFKQLVSIQEAKRYVGLLVRKFKNFNEKLAKRNHVMRHLFEEYVKRQDYQLVNTQSVFNQKIGRNAPCPCGSGKKYKRCCGQRSKRR